MLFKIINLQNKKGKKALNKNIIVLKEFKNNKILNAENIHEKIHNVDIIINMTPTTIKIHLILSFLLLLCPNNSSCIFFIYI